MTNIIAIKTPPQMVQNLAPLKELQALTAHEMQGVDRLINDKMASDEATIPDIGAHIVKAGGKRLRPMLTLAAAHLCDYTGRDHIALATAVELMHTATLLHDDVVDESDMRRGLTTSRMNWGNAASVLVGDFMLGQAFKMMVSTGSLEALDVLSNAAAVIAEGEVMQLASMNNIHMSEDAYLKVINAKTAALFSAATEVGGVIARQDNTTRVALSTYGRNLGIAFQLIDDVLDYGGTDNKAGSVLGAEGALGKNIGDDFREGKITLPVALAYQAGTAAEKEFWQRTMVETQQNEGDLKTAIDILHQHDGLGMAAQKAEKYGQMAKDALAIFPDTQYRRVMIGIVDFCISRGH